MIGREITDWLEAHPINQAMRRQVTECAHTRLDMIGIDLGTRGAEVKMLDYACGNGFYSRVNNSPCAGGRNAMTDENHRCSHHT